VRGGGQGPPKQSGLSRLGPRQMQISAVRATPISIPLLRETVMSHGAPAARVTRTIVEVEVDSGLVGLGETCAGPWTEIITSQFAPAIEGLDPRELSTIRRRCLPDVLDYGTPLLFVEQEAFGGLEVALWDLIAKSLDLPLYRALGGAVRASAPFVAYSYAVAAGSAVPEDDVPAAMAEHARESLEQTGSNLFEFKVGRNSLACEIATVRAVREAVGPDVDLALDANMGFTPQDARTFMGGIASARIANFEEPVASLAELARLRADYGIPVSTHCSNVDTLRAYPEIDGVVVGLDTQGGIAATLRLVAALSALGRRCWLRSFPETGVLWAAMVHLGLACRELDRPGQALIETLEDDVVEGDPWFVRNGGVTPPDTPGLGVELDREALRRYHDEYLRVGRQKDFSPTASRAPEPSSVGAALC
jgi:glucarate dehydratase